MRILFVVNEIPYPPDNGVRIVSHNVMRLMHEAGHELALAVLTCEAENNEERFKKAAEFCNDGMAWWMQLPQRSGWATLLNAMAGRRLFFIERYRSPLFREKLRSLVEVFEPDVIHFDLIPMTQYRDIAPGGIGTVASINDCYALVLKNALENESYTGFEYFYRRLQYVQTCRYEAGVYPKFDVTHVMSGVDEEYLHFLNPSIRTAVIPNGVDQSLFGIVDQTRGKTDLIFVAKLEDDNLLSLEAFLKQAWPIIHKECPEVKFHIVGKIGAQAQNTHRRFADMDGVIFHGYVDQVKDAYSQCGIAIVPVNKNCGIINKAIEAMAAGLVTVGFKKAFTALVQAKQEKDFISAERYNEIGCAVVNVIRNRPLREAIQRSAGELAAKYYSWSGRVGLYESMYQTSFGKQKRLAQVVGKES